MTVKFSRSVRSVQADNLVPVLVGISFFTLIMVGWLIWFFAAEVPTYTTSTSAVYQREGYLLAEFPEATIGQIRRGQPARWQLTVGSAHTSIIPLIVSDVDPDTRRVRLILNVERADFTGLPVGATGQVQVAVRQDSPALFVLRAAGLWPDS